MATLRYKICMQVRSVYTRITLSPTTIAFLILSLTSCIAQASIQSVLYWTDANAASTARGITHEAQVPTNVVAWVNGPNDDLTLQLCGVIPYDDFNHTSCTPIFPVTSATSSSNAPMSDYNPCTGLNISSSGMEIDSDVQLSTVRNGTGEIVGVCMDDLQFVSRTCAEMLVYPGYVLDNTRREDLALILAQVWLVAISLFAISYNSIPHILAVICTRLVQTGWSAFALWRTTNVQARFHTLFVDSGTPCQADFFPAYFTTRKAVQIPDVALNAVALLASAWLGWSLVKVYSKSTFQRVGPPIAIVRIYRYFLAIFVLLQLSAFFLVTAMSLWVDQLLNSPIEVISSHTGIYDALFLFTVLTLIPWIAIGWFAVRRELSRLMMLFLLICAAYFVCWAVMLYSKVFRWTFVQWPFFACITVSSFVVLVASGICGVVCWCKFGKGLAHYLHVEAILAESNFAQEVFTHDPEPELSRVRSPSIMSDRPTLKRDHNWDFRDIERPPIYIIDLEDHKF
ncbi:hypothetical protein OBBRIDRAFT_753300 [Obba rivulosa]|uniref:Uncharacterized protein n=1 Tax=Obba rivulosa TaxID=1052685 RepID=A0A8E2AY65_9APHY|nr:hypothetical protein OBBRIDRAFT_753300 [Obba rivulosa]